MMRIPFAGCLGVLLILSFEPAARAVEGIQQISGTWSGKYLYPDGQDEKGAPVKGKAVDFKAKLRVAGKGFAGEITERTQAHRDDTQPTELHAFVKGFVTLDGDVEFTKEYDGTGDWSHKVKYQGKLSDDRKKMNGEWRIDTDKGSYSGSFDMQLKSK